MLVREISQLTAASGKEGLCLLEGSYQGLSIAVSEVSITRVIEQKVRTC